MDDGEQFKVTLMAMNRLKFSVNESSSVLKLVGKLHLCVSVCKPCFNSLICVQTFCFANLPTTICYANLFANVGSQARELPTELNRSCSLVSQRRFCTLATSSSKKQPTARDSMAAPWPTKSSWNLLPDCYRCESENCAKQAICVL